MDSARSLEFGYPLSSWTIKSQRTSIGLWLIAETEFPVKFHCSASLQA